MNAVMKFINSFAHVSGLEFEDGWQYNRRLAFTAFLNTIVWPVGLYSMYTLFPSPDVLILQGGVAFNLTVWTKMIFVSRNHKKYMSVVHFIFKVLGSNSSGPRERILFEMTKNIFYHFKINISGFMAGCLFYAVYPAYDFIFNRKLTLISPIILPYIDVHQIRGYLLVTVLNIVLLCFCLTVCISVSCLFFTILDAYDGLVSLLEDDFKTFNVMCKKKERGGEYKTPFRNLMMGLTDLARFSSYTNELYGLISTVQIAMSYLVVVLCLVGFLAFGYVGGIGAATAFFTEMILYCYMGQLLDDTNNRIEEIVYDTKWYTYELKYQRDIVTALYIAQNLEPICLANVYPLNFDTGLQLTNNIYSIIMFMLSMIE